MHVEASPPIAQSHSVRVRLLGKLEITIDGRITGLADWPRRRALELFLLLVDAPSHQIHRDQAIETLWPDLDPDSASNALYKALHALRRFLEPNLNSGRESAFIRVRGETISLRESLALWIDTEEFSRLVSESESRESSEQRRLLRSALSLVRGQLVSELPYEDWIEVRRSSVHSTTQRVTIRLAKLDREANDPLASLPWLESALVIDRTFESAHRQIMRAYAAAGQRREALRQYEICRLALEQDLGVGPESRTSDLAEAIRSSIGAENASRGSDEAGYEEEAFGSNLFMVPALPNLTIGRERDLIALHSLAIQPGVRLITIAGPGGVGKTRIATQLASNLRTEHRRDIVFASLASATNADRAWSLVADTFGLLGSQNRSWLELVTERLRTADTLLILDNLEQINDIAPQLATLLEACSNLQVVATSRTRLHIRAEHVWELDPLGLAPEGMLDGDAIAAYPAPALFLQVSRQYRFNRVPWANRDLQCISGICRLVDGLPLAIELAAVQTIGHTPSAILAELQERSIAATLRDGPRDLPERQQTIEHLVRWSVALLSPEARGLFPVLSVFAGGVEIDAIQALISTDPTHLISELVDHHLASWGDGDRRIVMLETVREVAGLLLAERNEGAFYRRKHLEFFNSVARAAEEDVHGNAVLPTLQRLDRDLANIRAALSFGFADDQDSANIAHAASIATRLLHYWRIRGLFPELHGWIERIPEGDEEVHRSFDRSVAAVLVVLARRIPQLSFDEMLAKFSSLPGPEEPDRLTVMVEIERGGALRFGGDLQGSLDALRNAASIGRLVSAPWLLASALSELGQSLHANGQQDEGVQSIRDAVEIARSGQDLFAETEALTTLALNTMQSGDNERAFQIAIEAERRARLLDNRSMLPWALYTQMAYYFYSERWDESTILARELLEIFTETGVKPNVSSARKALALNLGMGGKYNEAIILWNQILPELIDHADELENLTTIQDLAYLFRDTGELATATRVLSATSALLDGLGFVSSPQNLRWKTKLTEDLRSGLGDLAFEDEWTSGLGISPEECLMLVGSTIARLAGNIEHRLPTNAKS